MRRFRTFSLYIVAALFSGAAAVHASELSNLIKASDDLCLSLAKTPAADRIAAATAFGYTQLNEEHLPVTEPHITLISRTLPTGDYRDIGNVSSFRSAIAQYDTSRPIFAMTVIQHQPVPAS